MTGEQLFTTVYLGAPVIIVALGALATWFALHAPAPDESGPPGPEAGDHK